MLHERSVFGTEPRSNHIHVSVAVLAQVCQKFPRHEEASCSSLWTWCGVLCSRPWTLAWPTWARRTWSRRCPSNCRSIAIYCDGSRVGGMDILLLVFMGTSESGETKVCWAPPQVSTLAKSQEVHKKIPKGAAETVSTRKFKGVNKYVRKSHHFGKGRKNNPTEGGTT